MNSFTLDIGEFSAELKMLRLVLFGIPTAHSGRETILDNLSTFQGKLAHWLRLDIPGLIILQQ